jgi:Phosphotransferase enzyme family
MGHRKSILSPLGYEVAYKDIRKHRGSDAMLRTCFAIKGGVKYYAFKICGHDNPDHYRRIQSIQASIPRMVRMEGPIEDVVLLEEARGEILWEVEPVPDPAVVENQLIEFALGTKANQLIHGDLRPWNVFFDKDCGVQVIDWWCVSSFVDDLIGNEPRRRDLIEGHYARFHANLVAQRNFTVIDLADAHRIGKLLRGDIGFSQAWPASSPWPWYPAWCRR